MKVHFDAPITEVTVQEDRAKIKRVGKVHLESGSFRLVIDGISPVIVDKTLIISRSKGSSVRIGSLSIKREVRSEEQKASENHQQITNKIQELTKQKEELRQESVLIKEQYVMLEKISSQTLEEVSVDVAWNQEFDKMLQKKLVEFDSQLFKFQDEIVRLEQKKEDIEEQIHKLTTIKQTLENPKTYHTALIEVDLFSEDPKECELTLEYTVPNAFWRPQHLAKLDHNQVIWNMNGCVWQNTGEDWNNVQLFFSTQRPSLGIEPPMLSADFLSSKIKPKEEVVETRSQEIQDVGLGTENHSPQNVDSQVLGIDDGGVVQNLKASKLANVPTTGTPFQVTIQEFYAPVKQELILMPELATTAFFKTEQTNQLKTPLLAGPVTLVRNGGYIGQTSILYIAPNEKFEISWGPDPELRVDRQTQHKKDKSNIISSWERTQYQIELRISNLSSKPKEILMQERIPVSELEKVQIQFEEEKDLNFAKYDKKNGILTWKVKLEGFQHQEVTFQYHIRKHKDIVGI